MKSIILFFIACACLNPILRVNAESIITPFYVFSPILFLLLMVGKINKNQKIFLLLLLLYGFIAGYLYGTPSEIQLFKAIKIIQLFTFLWMIDLIIKSHQKNDMLKLITINQSIFFIALVIAVIQQIIYFPLPWLVYDHKVEQTSSIFSNDNELALFISSSLFVFILANKKTKKIFKFAIVSTVLFIDTLLDAKTIIIGLLLSFLTYFYLKKSIQIGINRKISFFLVIVVVFISIPFFSIGIDFLIQDESKSINYVLYEPIKHLLSLSPFDTTGSIPARTNVVIYNIKELLITNFIGTGHGGSYHVLSMPEYETYGAKSMHNAILEFFVEYGYFAILSFIILYKVFHKSLRKNSIIAISLFVSLPFFAMAEGGIYTSYGFWLSLYLTSNFEKINQ